MITSTPMHVWIYPRACDASIQTFDLNCNIKSKCEDTEGYDVDKQVKYPAKATSVAQRSTVSPINDLVREQELKGKRGRGRGGVLRADLAGENEGERHREGGEGGWGQCTGAKIKRRNEQD